MKSGSWLSILGIYIFGVCGSSTVSKIIPLSNVFESEFGLAAASFGWLVSLLAIPAAIFAIPSGMVVDRLGGKNVLIIGAALGIVANLMYYTAQSLTVIQAARVLEGFAIVHLYTAGPAMLMASTDGDRRTRAMTLWSTYAPVGTATGLFIGGLFAESAGWRTGFLLHGGMFAIAGALAFLQPKIEAPATAGGATLGERIADLGAAFVRPMLVLLALGFFLIISMGLGANVTFPDHLVRVHEISMQVSSNMVATTTLAMVLGSLAVGVLLPKGVRPPVMFTALAVLGFVFGALCFYPDLSVTARWAVLFGWFVLTGAALATVMAMLPMVAAPGRQGSAAALINFAGASATFVNPPLWLAISESGQWTGFVGLLAIGWFFAVGLVWGAAILVLRAKASQETSAA